VSSPGLGLGVVELRLVPTPLSGGEDVPFTMGLPAGVWGKNRIRKAKVLIGTVHYVNSEK